MKKLFLFVAITMVFAFASCSNDQDAYLLEKKDLMLDKHKSLIKELGYDVSGILQEEDYYIVEGDIAIPKDYLDELPDNPETRQTYYGSYNLVSVAKQNPIKVYIQDYGISSNALWKTAFTNAISKWNTITSTNIKFAVGSAFDQNIMVNLTNGVGSFFSSAQIPSSGNPGYAIYVYTNYQGASFNANQKLMQAIHLLGHAIGLGHTQTSLYPTYYDVVEDIYDAYDLVPGTYAYDDASVMVKNNFAASFSDFSYYDKLAVQKLYPTITANLTIGGNSQCVKNAEYTFKVEGVPSNLTINKVTWSVTSGTGFSMLDSNNTTNTNMRFKFTSTGSKTLKAVVKFNGVSQEFSATKTITVIERPPLSNFNLSYSPANSFVVGNQITASFNKTELENVMGTIKSVSWEVYPDASSVEFISGATTISPKFTIKKAGRINLKPHIQFLTPDNTLKTDTASYYMSTLPAPPTFIGPATAKVGQSEMYLPGAYGPFVTEPWPDNNPLIRYILEGVTPSNGCNVSVNQMVGAVPLYYVSAAFTAPGTYTIKVRAEAYDKIYGHIKYSDVGTITVTAVNP